ncbi:MAG: hypothetical protein AB1646_10880 [Thermodesulfobacteriota bacterium]
MCVIRIAAVGILMAVVLAPVGGFADDTIETLMKEGMQAEAQDSPQRAEEKYRKIIEKDPQNYHALVRLAQLEMKQLSGPKRGDMALVAQEYLLRASLSQPRRPEAYLALAQLKYLLGYVPEGDEYARMARSIDPESYQAFCLLGQRYEDSGNYLAAMRQYSEALDHYPYDVYLSERRFLAAANGGLRPYDIYAVALKDIGGKGEGGTPAKVEFELLYDRYPDFYLLSQFEQEAGHSPRLRGRYFLPEFPFKYCVKDRQPSNPYADLYEAFIKASTTDPGEYSRLRAELDKIRKEALNAIATAGSQGRSSATTEDVAKARALYQYLKTKILKEYDLKRGVSAKDLLDHKRYLCLNASILFALIGREAGLPIDGFILPGHSFAVVNAKPGNVSVDMIPMTIAGTPGDRGFGVNWRDQFEALSQPGNYGGLLADPASSDRSVGEVSPHELTAYQFVNVLAAGLGEIEEKRKDEKELARNLLTELIQDNRDTQTQIQEIRNRYQQEPEKLASLLNKAREKHLERRRANLRDIAGIRYKIDREKAEYLYRTGLGLLDSARGIAPRVEEFVDLQESIYAAKADIDARTAKDAAKDREQRRDEIRKELTDKRLNTEFEERLPGGNYSQHIRSLREEAKILQSRLEDIDKEAADRWPMERHEWVHAIKGLSEAAVKIPCSARIQKRLEAYLWIAAKTSEKMGDNETLQQVVEVGLSRLPDSEFAKHYRAGQL